MSAMPTRERYRDLPGRSGSARHPLKFWERATLVHVGTLLTIASWAVGGGAPWARTMIESWGAVGAVLTLVLLVRRGSEGWRMARPLWPFFAYNALVVASAFNPSSAVKTYEGETLLAITGAQHPAWPSSVWPAESLDHLWMFDVLFLSAFNLLVGVNRRRSLRALLLFACGQAVVLSVFGIFQRLLADGLFFGAVPSPNARFFATFVYGNHWAAYIVLWVAAGLALMFHYLRRGISHDYGPAPLVFGGAGLLLMAITPAVAGSRAGVAMMLVLLAVAAIGVVNLVRRRGAADGTAARWSLLGVFGAAALLVFSATYLGRDAIEERWRDTQGQWRTGLVAERLDLYADTVKLFARHPAFGWGVGSFDKTLQLLRPRPVEQNRQYEHSYVDAHSDWLQSLAEVGAVGTSLMVMIALAPLLVRKNGTYGGSVSAYLLGGCVTILLYAAVEFPFANPAVVVAWWICFFSAIQYARLQRREPPGGAGRPAFPA